MKNTWDKSERPVDALVVKKGESLSDNLKSRDASASKNSGKHMFIDVQHTDRPKVLIYTTL